MADQGFPESHTTTTQYTTTTTTTTSTGVAGATRPYLDTSYIRTVPGIVKIVQIVLSFICFICVVAGPLPYFSAAGWGTFVSIVSFLVTLILLIMYLFHLIEMLHVVPWLLVEMVYCFIWTLFYLIAASVLASTASTYVGAGAYGAAAFFGFAAMGVYGFDCYLKFKAWRNGELPQGAPPV